MTKFCPSSIFKCYIVNHTNRCLDNEIHIRPVTTLLVSAQFKLSLNFLRNVNAEYISG